MRHSLEDSGMVRWQGRRLDGHTRARTRLVRLLLGLAALSVASLIVGFYAGLPVPLGLLRTLLILLLAGAAVFAAKAAIDALVHREGRKGRW